jgi:hypothetical protein
MLKEENFLAGNSRRATDSFAAVIETPGVALRTTLTKNYTRKNKLWPGSGWSLYGALDRTFLNSIRSKLTLSARI